MAISFIQRHAKGKDVNFYFDRRQLLGKWLLPAPFEAWPLAVVRCSLSGHGAICRASVWVVNGRIAELIFSEPPGKHGGKCTIASVAVVLDPLDSKLQELGTAKSSVPDLSNASATLHGFLAELAENDTARLPLDTAMTRRLLAPTDGCLPRDYVELLGYTNGFKRNGWNVLGPPLQEIAMEGPNLFVLAESTRPYILCAKDRNDERSVFLVNMEEDFDVKCLGDSFVDALEAVAKP